MKQVQLEANVRTVFKKNAMNRLRTARRVPAVLYGRGETNTNLDLSSKEVGLALRNHGTNVMVKLNIMDGDQARQETVMFKALQRHPVTSEIEHVDFVKLSMDQLLETTVPVHVSGTAPGLKEGGMLEQIHRELEIRCLPAMIPESFTVDVSSLRIGDAFFVKDLALPEGVTVLVAGHEPIVHVVAPRAEEAPAAEAGVVPAEAKQPEVIGEKEREERRTEKEKKG